MEGILAILIVLVLLCFICNIFSEDISSRVISCFCLFICNVLLMIIIITYISKDEPTAKDVYQGKTTLEITYRDSIPIDTIVVYKKEFKK